MCVYVYVCVCVSTPHNLQLRLPCQWLVTNFIVFSIGWAVTKFSQLLDSVRPLNFAKINVLSAHLPGKRGYSAWRKNRAELREMHSGSKCFFTFLLRVESESLDAEKGLNTSQNIIKERERERLCINALKWTIGVAFRNVPCEKSFIENPHNERATDIR